MVILWWVRYPRRATLWFLNTLLTIMMRTWRGLIDMGYSETTTSTVNEDIDGSWSEVLLDYVNTRKSEVPKSMLHFSRWAKVEIEILFRNSSFVSGSWALTDDPPSTGMGREWRNWRLHAAERNVLPNTSVQSSTWDCRKFFRNDRRAAETSGTLPRLLGENKRGPDSFLSAIPTSVLWQRLLNSPASWMRDVKSVQSP